MKKYLSLIAVTGLIIFTLIGCKNESSKLPTENFYWPGNFEQALYGGNFSKELNLQVSDSENATPDGKRSWYLPPKTYQHLELLTEGEGDFRLSFKGKASGPLPVIIKVVYRDETDSTRTEDYRVDLLGDSTWHDYTVDYTLYKPYPGPRVGEFLITCYNPGVEAWIDDVEIRRTSPDDEELFTEVNPKYVSDLLQNGSFELGTKGWQCMQGKEIDPTIVLDQSPCINKEGTALHLGYAEGYMPAVGQKIDGKTLAGRNIRISAEAGFLSITEDAYSWAGVLISLKNGSDASASLIHSEPEPLWCPLGLSSPPGSLKKISAVYTIPEDVNDLFLFIEAQQKINMNIAVVDNLVLELLP